MRGVGGLIAGAAILVLAVGAGTAGGGARVELRAPNCAPVYFEGPGTPQLIVASDFPLQGFYGRQAKEAAQAVRYELKQRGFKAGAYTVGYQSCDDSTAAAGRWDSGKCSANANGYAQTPSVIAVVGTFNSGCAEIEIPILNEAAGGPVGMVSPANTYIGLTHRRAGIDPDEPGRYYPTGKRNYMRLVAADDYQGASNAMLARQLGYRRVFVIWDKELYGYNVATAFRRAAGRLGVKVAGFTTWEPAARDYRALARRVAKAHVRAVYLGGLECENGSKLVKDLRSVLGRKFPLIAGDGFTPFSATYRDTGGVARGMFISEAGLTNGALGATGKAWVAGFRARIGHEPDPYSAYSAQALDVILDGIAASDGTRAGTTAKLLQSQVSDGIIGPFSFDRNGDVTRNAVTQYRLVAPGKGVVFRTIVPPARLVN